MKVVDFFCGCGGLSLGFIQAGFEVVAGFDNNESALNTFKKNHGKCVVKNIDLFDRDSLKDQLDDALKNEIIDVIVGGPPCQGFSLTGPRKFDDKRNSLYLSMIDAVEILQPKAFVLENVTGIVNLYNGQIKDEIVRRLDLLNYNVSFKILNAADYGVPQIRKRAFFVGIKKTLGEFIFPDPICKPDSYVTCREAISDLPSLEYDLGSDVAEYTCSPKSNYQYEMRKNSKKLYNHVGTAHKDFVVEVIKQVPEGGNHKDLPEGVGTHRKFNEAWTRYDGNKPSRTIDTGHRNHFHYKWNRVPTVRENARLQSFPDDFIFLGNKTQQNRQVGNAVPPKFGNVIALQLLKYLKGD